MYSPVVIDLEAEMSLFHELYPAFVRGGEVEFFGMSIVWSAEASARWHQYYDFCDLLLKSEENLRKYATSLMHAVCLQRSDASIAALEHAHRSSAPASAGALALQQSSVGGQDPRPSTGGVAA